MTIIFNHNFPWLFPFISHAFFETDTDRYTAWNVRNIFEFCGTTPTFRVVHVVHGKANKDQMVFHFSTISTHMFHTENTNSHQFSAISILHFESKGPQDFKSKCRNWGPRLRKRRKLGSTSAWLTCKIMQRHDTAAQNRRVERTTRRFSAAVSCLCMWHGMLQRLNGLEQRAKDWKRQVDTKRHSVGPPDRWSCAKKTLWKLQSDCGWKR